MAEWSGSRARLSSPDGPVGILGHPVNERGQSLNTQQTAESGLETVLLKPPESRRPTSGVAGIV